MNRSTKMIIKTYARISSKRRAKNYEYSAHTHIRRNNEILGNWSNALFRQFVISVNRDNRALPESFAMTNDLIF